jgi:hypothetical protein
MVWIAIITRQYESGIKNIHCKKRMREISMWTTVARTKRRGGQKISTSTFFGSAPPLATSEFSACFFYSVYSTVSQPSSKQSPDGIL